MKKSFAARRIPRKIGTDDEEVDGDGDGVNTSQASTLKRPTIGSKKSSQVRRVGATLDDEADGDTGVRTPKRAGLSKIAIQRNAGQRSSFRASELPQDGDDIGDSVPTYSAADLQALKDSTPVTPSNFEGDPEPSSVALELNDKFGSSLAKYGQPSAIPSATEIAEKKARRARLVLEQKAEEYISLDPDDPGWQEDEDGNVMKDMDGRLVLREKDRYGIQESRLVRDDEDVMEGFDEFTGEEGSRIIMGTSAKGLDQQARRDEISRQIAQAEGDSEAEELDGDEKARNAAFEAAQTRHGTLNTDQAARYNKYAAYRAKTPPIITPIPTLNDVVKRFRASVLDLENKKREKQAERLQLSEEKLKLKDEEERVQRQLKEVAEKYRQLKIEKGFLPKDAEQTTSSADSDTKTLNGHVAEPAVVASNAGEDAQQPSHMGLGATGSPGSQHTSEDHEDDRPRMGMGFGSAATGLGWTA